MSSFHKGLLALLATALFWGLGTTMMRGLLNHIPALTLLFLRFGVATILFMPFFISLKPWRRPKFGALLAISSLVGVNQTFFLTGLQRSSATMSQVVYAGVPLLIILLSFFLFHEQFPLRKIVGVVVGFCGIGFIMILSFREGGSTIAGSLRGNILLCFAVLFWSLYLLLSKKLSPYFSPLVISGTSVMMAAAVALPLALGSLIVNHTFGSFTTNDVISIVFIAVVPTFLTYLLYQYALNRLTALGVSLSTYLGPIVTAGIAFFLLGERLTGTFVVGSILVFAGIFITTTLEIHHQRK